MGRYDGGGVGATKLDLATSGGSETPRPLSERSVERVIAAAVGRRRRREQGDALRARAAS